MFPAVQIILQLPGERRRQCRSPPSPQKTKKEEDKERRRRKLSRISGSVPRLACVFFRKSEFEVNRVYLCVDLLLFANAEERQMLLRDWIEGIENFHSRRIEERRREGRTAVVLERLD